MVLARTHGQRGNGCVPTLCGGTLGWAGLECSREARTAFLALPFMSEHPSALVSGGDSLLPGRQHLGACFCSSTGNTSAYHLETWRPVGSLRPCCKGKLESDASFPLGEGGGAVPASSPSGNPGGAPEFLKINPPCYSTTSLEIILNPFWRKAGYKN